MSVTQQPPFNPALDPARTCPRLLASSSFELNWRVSRDLVRVPVLCDLPHRVLDLRRSKLACVGLPSWGAAGRRSRASCIVEGEAYRTPCCSCFTSSSRTCAPFRTAVQQEGRRSFLCQGRQRLLIAINHEQHRRDRPIERAQDRDLRGTQG